MSTFEQPLCDSWSPRFLETLWASYNIDGSPVSFQDDCNFSSDLMWQSPICSLPDGYSLDFDNWLNQCATPLCTFSSPNPPLSMGQFPDSRMDMTTWLPSCDSYAPPIPFIAGSSSNPAGAFTSPYNTSLDQPSQQSFPAPQSHHPSRLESNHISPTSPMNPADTNPNGTRAINTPIRCFEHSCGGRAFSSLGNYERHLREKSGRAKSFTCELCGQRFTRSTAKNKHVKYGRCRVRPAR